MIRIVNAIKENRGTGVKKVKLNQPFSESLMLKFSVSCVIVLGKNESWERLYAGR
jgi:hypothetical protein